MHPVEIPGLTISIPVDNDRVIMMELISKAEAEEIIESFKLPGIAWIEISSHRTQEYSEIVKKGNRKEIAKIANTLMRKKLKVELKRKRLYEQDSKLLNTIQSILFLELAMSFNTTVEDINERITNLIAASDE